MALGGIMALAIVGAAIGGGTAVFAQEDESPAPPTGEFTLQGEGRGHGPRQGGGYDSTYLADALGITVDELDAAKETVRSAQKEEAVAQALADDLITQEQADAILAGERPEGDINFRGIFNKGERGSVDEDLAAELDISVDELEAAQEAAREAAIEQAIADGTITQEQVDLREAGQALREYTDHESVLADLLGIPVEELEAAKEDGSIRDLVEASGLTPEEIQVAMEEARAVAVAEAVADGVITQEQADQLEEAPGRGGKGGSRGGSPRGSQGNGEGGPRSGGNQNGNGSAVPNTNNTDA